MNKLLTIAIPTFNRSEFLNKQLAWLAEVVKGFESECEIFISDNCSTDNTQEVIKNWQETLSNIKVKYNRNSQNIGLMRNFSHCLQAATSKYVWVIADDHTIQQKTLAYVVQNLKDHPDLSLLALNFSIRSIPTGEIVIERVFEIENEEVRADGRAVIEHSLAADWILGLMSGMIYKTEAIKLALQNWPSSPENAEGQIYWSAFCATQGSIKITKQTYIEYASPMFFQTKPKEWFKRHYAELPEVYMKLIEIGYDKKFCRELILKHFTQKNNWKVVLGAIRRWPLLAITTMVSYFRLVGVSAWEVTVLP
ncbi:family 2 glycosyl transferase [Scytonema sp. HK-05]|uniref:glycosyltransferase family 2 protein n=1 Tax=Scytonema sp. HK-05 TaxID=1137095 RepID=UPI0009358FD2|nr:glycosyltransferase family 2 protein [Scytonema sp. HK-05]OKH57704.1 glycosyltransferase [Scytonema sp. HK-05]BAY44360.1 family 2 glycosyl transferase [Scytonema sp. HK-05]